MLIIGAGALVVGLTIYALLDAVRTPAREERTLPKWLWVLVTLFFPVVGPVLWLLLGRPKRERGARGSISLPGAAQRGNTPSMASPDDDEAYLRRRPSANAPAARRSAHLEKPAPTGTRILTPNINGPKMKGPKANLPRTTRADSPVRFPILNAGCGAHPSMDAPRSLSYTRE